MSDVVTLFCFPFAGGNAYSYRPIEQRMNPAIKVMPLEPPGRGRRLKESRVVSMEEMVLDSVACIRDSLEHPFAFFGHSMGALTAYLVTRQLETEQLPLPRHIFVSGKGPPHRKSRESLWHALPLEDFKLKLYELGGCPAALLGDKELMEYFAPIIRDDMRSVAEYRYKAAPPLDLPITVMVGTTESTTSTEASEWNDMTTSDCRVLQYEGGHFFLFDHVDDICALINATLIEP